MSKTRPKFLVGKGLPTVVYAFLIAVAFISSSPVLAECQSSEKCGNETAVNSTLIFNQFSNSTISTQGFSNATWYENDSNLTFDQYSNSTLLFDEFSNSTLSFDQFDNSTSMGENDENQTLPNPFDSFQFASNDTDSTSGDNQGTNALHLQGDKYIDENSTVPNVKSLTVTAWVKPDYSEGSAVFTVVSDNNEFVLAVNNNMPATKHAVFSVFDGIKWTNVQSSSTISEEWTHLAATYNGTTIGIYVNGSLEKTANVTGIPVLVDGQLTTRAEQNLTSDANVTIGAYYDKTRHQDQSLFSGKISGVNLYDSVLTQAQIEKIFRHTKPYENSTSHN